MKVITDLYEKINEIIDKENDNNKIIENINKKFISKSINARKVVAVWNEYEQVENLSDIELMALTEAINEVEGGLKLNEYFSENKILNYTSLIKQEEENYISDTIIARNFQRLTDNVWQGKFTYKELYIIKKNTLTLYNKMTQRACNYKEIGTNGYKVATNYLDRKKVEEIKNLMKKGKYTPDTISLNIRLIDGKAPQMNWEESNLTDIGDLIIKPNYDVNSESTTFIDRLDGNHRYTAATEAFEEYLNETGRELEGVLSCQFVMMEVAEAKEYVARLFKRSDTDREWLSAMENDDYNKFVNNICNKIKNLDKNEISETWDQMKFDKAFTTKRILADAIKKTKIKVNVLSEQSIMSRKFAEIIDIELELLSNRTGKALSELRNTILKPHFFGGFMILADELKTLNNDDIVEMLINVNEKILSNTEGLDKLRLDNKVVSIDNIYKYFRELV